MENKEVVISFSSRIDGNCKQICDYICSYIDQVNQYCFTDFRIHPCGGCQYECFTNNHNCPYIGDMEYQLLDAICSSATTYFIVPNYCDYPCANFFIFNERSQCFFQNHPELLDKYLRVPKQFIVVSNSRSESIRNAFTQHTDREPEILWLSAKYYGKNSLDGDIMTEESVRNDLLRLIHNQDS